MKFFITLFCCIAACQVVQVVRAASQVVRRSSTDVVPNDTSSQWSDVQAEIVETSTIDVVRSDMSSQSSDFQTEIVETTIIVIENEVEEESGIQEQHGIGSVTDVDSASHSGVGSASRRLEKLEFEFNENPSWKDSVAREESNSHMKYGQREHGLGSLPGDGSSPLPDDGSSSLPCDGSSSLPGDVSSPLPDDASSSLPDDGSSSLPGDGSSSVPGDGSLSHIFIDIDECIPTPSPSPREPIITCEGATSNINCDPGMVINVLSVNYGRKSPTICNPGGREKFEDLYCVSENSFKIVSDQCSNKQSCSVQAANSDFGDPCVGTYKYLEVDYECVAPTPTRQRVVSCEDTILNINCGVGTVIDVLFVNYGRQSKAECNPDNSEQSGDVNCTSSNSFDIVSDQCSNKQSCTIQAANSVFGDPCQYIRKYLEVEYRCIERPFCQKAVACEGSNLDIKCGPKQAIVIQRANFGRTSSAICNDGNTYTTNCVSPTSKAIVEGKCMGKDSCSVPATNEVFQDPCVGTYKYLEVDYFCKILASF